MAVSVKLKSAAAATETVHNHVDEALGHLEGAFNGGRVANGYGIFSDPSAKRYALRQAMKHLTEALQSMDATSWPTSEDYNEAE